jgi:hypothetical protein
MDLSVTSRSLTPVAWGIGPRRARSISPYGIMCVYGRGLAEQCRIIFGPYPVACTGLTIGRVFRKNTIAQVDIIATRGPWELEIAMTGL